MKTVQIAVIFTLVVGAALLFRMQEADDSPLIGLLDAMPRPAAKRDEPARLNKQEQRVKEELQRALGEQTSVDRVVRVDGHEMHGRIIEETDRHVKIHQSFGDSGEMTITVNRDNIRSVHYVDAELPEISDRDVRFKMEFPKLNLYRRPPYTFMTSQNYFDVEYATQLLDDLHDDFVDVFEPVMATPEPGNSMQLQFFTEETAFKAYQRRHAPGLGFSVGFYSPSIDRFVIYDQRSSAEVKRVENQLSSMKKQYQRTYKSQQAKAAIHRWEHDANRQLRESANLETNRTLRHEGAHQLFHNYGVHSDHDAENLWLVEGLAVYCENERIGYRPSYSFDLLRESIRAERHIPFPRLINFRSSSGFGGIGTGSNGVSLAYAQSWLVVDFAMRQAHREQFFDYIRYVRDRKNYDALSQQSRFNLLSQFLKVPPAEVEQTLLDEMRRL